MLRELIYVALVFGGVVFGHFEYTLNNGDLHPHYGVVYYAGADGHKITLVHNENATDATYSQVMQFIESDTTDQIPFQKEKFTCGDYAERVQNNAENAGIRCAWVSIDFEHGGNGHACNAFNTTDKGLVFIDCTKGDAHVDTQIGQWYAPTPLDPNADYTIEPLGVVKNYEIYW
jgi:hypothetical protein